MGKIIRNNLEHVISALCAFSDSVQNGRKPDWPSNSVLALFTSQVEAFRSISSRRKDATPIQLIRDMNHRWTKLGLLDALDRVVCALETYSGKSRLGKVFFDKKSDGIATESILKHPLRTLVLGQRKATVADLPLTLSLAPSCFAEIEKSLQAIKCDNDASAASSRLTKCLNALALSVQAYLCAEHRRFLCHQTIALPLRTFLFVLKEPSYKKRLFGFSAQEIEMWHAFDDALGPQKVRKQGSARAQRFRDKQKTNTE